MDLDEIFEGRPPSIHQALISYVEQTHHPLDSAYLNDDWNVLQIACALGEADIVDKLLSDGMNPDHSPNDECLVKPSLKALHIAARNNHVQILRSLLPRASINAQDQFGFTALHYAVSNRCKEVVVCLIEYGCSVIIESKAGTNPLELARHLGYEDIADIISSKASREKDPTLPKFRDWLCRLGAGEFVTSFLNAGYDLAFIAKQGLTESDLDCVGVPMSKQGLRKKLLVLHQLDEFYTADEGEGEEDEDDGDVEDGEDEEEDDEEDDGNDDD